jgi:hypothetical protein
MTSMIYLAAGYHAAVRHDELMDDLATVAAVDRLQGSTGLYRVADQVAERAERAGLDVQLHHYPSETRWWDFTAPAAPSPVSASLHLLDSGRPEPVTTYPDQPCCLARGSASTPPAGVTAPLVNLDGTDPDDLAGAFVLAPPVPRFDLDPLLDRLAAVGAIGLAVQSATRTPANDEVVDRLEVPDTCPLVVFSLSTAQARRLRAAIGQRIRVCAVHEPPAPMPLVHAQRRSPAPVRGLLIAHLCHPAPGANDNASGVAALLGIARAAHRLHDNDGPALDFLWAPEMVGTAAYLHDIASTRPPQFAVSLDMVGAGHHLIIEESPDHLASPIAAAFEAAARAVSPDLPSYSGAVALPTWPRAVTPFVGASDHLLFADRSIAIPAGHLAHWPDPAHHTSADTADRIDPDELHRATVASAAAVTALSTGLALNDISTVMGDLHHVRLAQLLGPAPAIPAAVEYATRIDAAARTTLNRWHPRQRQPPPGDPGGGPATATAADTLVRRWNGPWNLHNLHRALPAGRRAALTALLADGAGGYARLVALALAINDHTDRHSVTRRAELAARLPIPADTATTFLDLLADAGWLAIDGNHPG